MIADSLISKELQQSIRPMLRYIVVGLATNSLGYGLFLLATYLDVEPKVAMSFLYALGASLGFFGNRLWSFAYKGNWFGSGLRYIIAHTCGYLINFIMLFMFVDKLGYPHQLVQAIAIGVVACFLFVTFRYFVFPKENNYCRGGE